MKNAIRSIREEYCSFSSVERKIADFILENTDKIIYMTIAALAAKINVSQGSIIRFSDNLGFSGYSELKLNIAQNLPNPEKVLDEEAAGQDTAHEVLEKLAKEIRRSFQMTISGIQNEELEKTAQLLTGRKRIELYGVGFSSAIAQDAYYRFVRQGLPAYAVTDPHIASVSASCLDEECAVIAVSYSGRTIETLKAVQIAKEKGAAVISLTGYEASPLAKLSDICLVSAAEETSTLKEAFAARYSQLLILDAVLMYLSLKDIGRAIQKAEKLSDIIGEHRSYE